MVWLYVRTNIYNETKSGKCMSTIHKHKKHKVHDTL